MKKIFLFAVIIIFNQTFCLAQMDSVKLKIQELINSSKADVGVSIWGINKNDTLSIHGNKLYPLMSVVKFHTALAILHQVDQKKLFLDQKVLVKKEDLISDTFSPMRDEKPKNGFEITIAELLKYSVSQSDNIAFLKLVDLLNGIKVVDSFIHKTRVENVSIVSTYRDSFTEILKNVTSPLAANFLLKKFYDGKILKNTSREYLINIMIESNTGPDRIKGLLPPEVKVAHKTGTGNDGINKAFNDIGIVILPDGKYFFISVFIANSKESDEINASVIASISKLAYEYFSK